MKTIILTLVSVFLLNGCGPDDIRPPSPGPVGLIPSIVICNTQDMTQNKILEAQVAYNVACANADSKWLSDITLLNYHCAIDFRSPGGSSYQYTVCMQATKDIDQAHKVALWAANNAQKAAISDAMHNVCKD